VGSFLSDVMQGVLERELEIRERSAIVASALACEPETCLVGRWRQSCVSRGWHKDRLVAGGFACKQKSTRGTRGAACAPLV
jgi:hypothetical protein